VLKITSGQKNELFNDNTLLPSPQLTKYQMKFKKRAPRYVPRTYSAFNPRVQFFKQDENLTCISSRNLREDPRERIATDGSGFYSRFAYP
jgi:hypothetical protein